PMFQHAHVQYEFRVPNGYPVIVDDVESGTIGLELDPSYSLYITSDGEDLYAEIYKRQSRTDNRSSSSRQKYGGMPFQDRRPMPANPDDQLLRNLISELKQAYNYQPGLLYIVD